MATSEPGKLDLNKLAKMEADIEARNAADAAERARRLQEVKTEGVSRAAILQRRRRLRPDVKEVERKALRARDNAMRKLAKKHPEEFMVYVQEARKALGLEPLQPRGKHRRTLEERAHQHEEKQGTPSRPASAKAVAKCVHSQYPINKLPYGNFCGNCGVRV